MIDVDRDPDGGIFTNARSKSEVHYRDSKELIEEVGKFFKRFGVDL